MKRTIIILVILMVAIAYTEATTRPQCHAVCRKSRPSVVKCVRDEIGCRKMKQCSIEEENCTRRLLNHKPLRTTKLSHCRYIKSPLGAGRCAPRQNYRIVRDVHPDCHGIHCTSQSKKLKCYRSRHNECQLLTACQVRRINCFRGRHNALIRTDKRQCKGIRNRLVLQKCRPIPKKD